MAGYGGKVGEGEGGVTLTLRHTDPRVKTTGRKSHDPLKLRDREREGAGSGEWRDKHGEGGVLGGGVI